MSTLERIERGSLHIEAQNGEIHTFGPGGSPSSYLNVKSDAFWVRLFLFADMVSNFGYVSLLSRPVIDQESRAFRKHICSEKLTVQIFAPSSP